MRAIEFKNVSFRYEDMPEPVLKNASFSLEYGRLALLYGDSGQGKSTVLSILSGVIPNVTKGTLSGEVRIGGEDVSGQRISDICRRAGVVLQNADAQIIHQRVEDELAFGCENFAFSPEKIGGCIEKACDRMALCPQWGTRTLSGGQKQRLITASALTTEQKILLLDEPLANLDPATGKRAIDLIDRICRERHKTVIIIEHRLEDALYRDVDRIVVIGDGRVVADMTPDELLASDILIQEGIREPLYVTALKHAGCQVAAKDHPQHIETMHLEPYQEKVRTWFEKVSLPETQAEEKPALEVLDLDFSYITGKPILSDIHFRINKGEMLAIVGKNGAGKSTLSNLICGFIHPDHGKILLNGSDIADKSIKERGEAIGLVMQNPNQMISKPMIFDEVALGLRVRGVPEEEVKERVYEKLKICGLYPFRNWPVSALSFGQKKRVTIASILVMNPEILILDEPTRGVDVNAKFEIYSVINELAKAGIAVIMVSSELPEIINMCDNVCVIKAGRMTGMLGREELDQERIMQYAAGGEE